MTNFNYYPMNTFKDLRNRYFTTGLMILLLVTLSSHRLSASEEQLISTTPVPRLQSYEWMSLATWYRMHADDVEIAEAGKGKILFIGDSIIQGWTGPGMETWKEYFEPMGAINFGIGGDMTQNVLWRLDHGAVGNLAPERIVLLIGINNFGFTSETPTQIAVGHKMVVEKLHEVFPGAKILVFAVFPSGEFPDNPLRAKIKELYELTRSIETIEGVTYVNIGDEFLLEDGRIPKEMMPDFLHPTLAGYKIMSEVVMKWLVDVAS